MARILIVGGTGLTGAHAALHLRELGHEVTLMSRSAPTLECLQEFEHIAADYVQEPLSAAQWSGFEQMVFAAGADIRQFPRGQDEAAFYTRVNVEAIPAFFASARSAGLARAVYIGSFYPQVAPEAIARSVYVRSRHLADEGVRQLDCDSFSVCSLNAPFILGHVPGLRLPHVAAMVDYARGKLEGVPLLAPAGGTNHISSESMSAAIASALEQGRGGHDYLVGDENLSWKTYLERFFRAAGNPVDLPVSEQEHPLFPDVMMYAGRNARVSYEPELGELSYPLGRIQHTIEQVVSAYG
ncbi:NAD-dependent epimerase/dehydratase family protein [Pseudohalioglobus sediminis]|uniref:NAD-dependent epimerase/dehydratase family protein n=1 Tax=Pseudohalioglobus sediminis TaxID=2606449 RepID=A0A5B0X1F6_9GAMM|nr:NAD-dependent epimerase/dehydratase family protein [Pseudohalioglobus sediminis]KAA1193184.1 NAD-dependent epimerase/dehydratase family protein [Pseudohalioglobus sediminis]